MSRLITAVALLEEAMAAMSGKAAAMSKKASQRKSVQKAKRAEGRVKPTPPKKKQVKKAAWAMPLE